MKDEAEDILFELAADAELAAERAREQTYHDWYEEHRYADGITRDG